MRVKKVKEIDGDNFMHAQPRPYAPDDLETCMWGHVADVISNRAKFFENGIKGFRATGP